MTTNDRTNTCALCGEHIDQHTGKYLVCPDGIHEFESLKERDEFDRSAYLNLADEFDPMGDAPDAEPLAFDPADWDEQAVAGARRFARKHALPLPWEVRSVDNAMALVDRDGEARTSRAARAVAQELLDIQQGSFEDALALAEDADDDIRDDIINALDELTEGTDR